MQLYYFSLLLIMCMYMCMQVWNMELLTCAQTMSRHEGSVTSLTGARGAVFSAAVDGSIKVTMILYSELVYRLSYSWFLRLSMSRVRCLLTTSVRKLDEFTRLRLCFGLQFFTLLVFIIFDNLLFSEQLSIIKIIDLLCNNYYYELLEAPL